VGLSQSVRFLVVKLNNSILNPRFDIGVTFMTNYFLVGCDVFIDSETLLMTDFMNLKIKSAQSFKCDHMDSVCICVFIMLSAHIYIYIYIYI
jgi:hypothetical protein